MFDLQKHRLWKRAHPDFPLTVHPRGYWSKKVRGKVYYFGPLKDRDAALRLWLREKDYLLAGEIPPTHEHSITVRELLDKHLADVDDRIVAGKLACKTRGDYRAVRRLFEQSMVVGLPVKALKPEHFTVMERHLENNRYSLRTQRNFIIATKAVFNWGRKMELFDCDIRYGPRFAVPSVTAIEAEQEENGSCRFLDRDVILTALAAAKPKLKVAILLGINCGFYPSDTVAITLDHLHLDGKIPYHDFRRVKTKRRRMAALWPETVEAIQDYQRDHRKSASASERCLLLSRSRRRYSPGGRELSLTFNRVLDGNRSLGVSLGSLRHTYATVVDLVPDQAMIDLTMGHTSKSLQKRVYKQLNLHELARLQVVANVVCGWLLGGGS